MKDIIHLYFDCNITRFILAKLSIYLILLQIILTFVVNYIEKKLNFITRAKIGFYLILFTQLYVVFFGL